MRKEVAQMHKDYVMQSWARSGADTLPVERAEGIYFYDYDGKKYADMASLLVCSNLGARRAVRRGLGRVLLLRRAQDIAHAVERHARLAHVRKHAAERAHRPRQSLVIADEGEKFAERHIAVHALDDAADDDDHDLQARQ